MKQIVLIIIVAVGIAWYFFSGDGEEQGDGAPKAGDQKEAPNTNDQAAKGQTKEAPTSVKALTDSNRYAEAKALLEKTPAENRNMSWKTQMIDVQYGMGEYEAALTSLNEVLKTAKDGKKPELMWLQSKIMLSDGDKVKAGHSLYSIVQNYPDSEVAMKAAMKLKDLWKPLLKATSKNDDIPKFNKVLAYIVENSLDASLKKNIYQMLETLKGRLFSSPNPYSGVVSFHFVRSGEVVDDIAKKYGVLGSRLVRTNGLKNNGNSIWVGQKLRIIHGRARMVVDRESFTMHFYVGDYFYKHYIVGTGRNDKTPAVVTKVSKSRDKNPDFRDPETGIVYPFGHDKNPIGTRWMGLDMGSGYGIHGTTEENSVGKQSSNGCIRLRNQDVEELFDFVKQGDDVIIN